MRCTRQLASIGAQQHLHTPQFLRAEWASGAAVFPPRACLFRALNACPLHAVRLVIIAQDPYHTPGAACGLAFSVPRGEKIPSSLVNIFKELSSDVGLPRPAHGDLSRWAAQGVLLLNASLTVRSGLAGSHAQKGWETFTDSCVAALLRHRAGLEATQQPPLVCLLWGKHAQEKGNGVLRAAARGGAAAGVHVLSAPHPSGLSAHRGFFGCRHFSAANALLTAAGAAPIDWHLD